MRCSGSPSEELSGTPLCQGSRHESGRNSPKGESGQESCRSLLDIALYAQGSSGITYMGNCLFAQLAESTKQALGYPGRKLALQESEIQVRSHSRDGN